MEWMSLETRQREKVDHFLPPPPPVPFAFGLVRDATVGRELEEEEERKSGW